MNDRMTATITQPASVIKLAPCQQRLFADQARVIVVNWHRQRGKDFCAAAKAVDNAIRTGQAWYIVSLTQRQADATFDKARAVASAFAMTAKRRAAITVDERQYVERDREIDELFHCTARTLHLPGGGSVTALPGRDPDTLAGLTGNVIFTEFGLFPKGGYDHWRVVFPLSTRGYQVIVISTPRGKNSKFYELWSQPETYSVHTQDINQSVAEDLILRDNNGDPTDIETFKKLYGDDAGWRREYLCEFTGDMEALVTWAQLVAAGQRVEGLSLDVTQVTSGNGWHAEFWRDLANTGRGRRPEIGWDVARHTDLSVIWVNLRGNMDPVRTLRKLVICRQTSFALQREIIRSLMDGYPAAVGCGDATGLGMDSNETLATLYGSRWQPVTFTQKTKRELGSGLMTAFDEGSMALPASAVEGEHKMIATDIYALQKQGDKANLIVSEGMNPLAPDSHCDIAWSAALAIRASGIAGTTAYLSVA